MRSLSGRGPAQSAPRGGTKRAGPAASCFGPGAVPLQPARRRFPADRGPGAPGWSSRWCRPRQLLRPVARDHGFRADEGSGGRGCGQRGGEPALAVAVLADAAAALDAPAAARKCAICWKPAAGPGPGRTPESWWRCFVMVAADHVAHFAREDERQRLVRQVEGARALKSPPCRRHWKCSGLGLVGNQEFESPDALVQLR